MDLHKEIGQWLFAFRLIPGSSPALSPNAQLSDLVAVLRDGVVQRPHPDLRVGNLPGALGHQLGHATHIACLGIEEHQDAIHVAAGSPTSGKKGQPESSKAGPSTRTLAARSQLAAAVWS